MHPRHDLFPPVYLPGTACRSRYSSIDTSDLTLNRHSQHYTWRTLHHVILLQLRVTPLPHYMQGTGMVLARGEMLNRSSNGLDENSRTPFHAWKNEKREHGPYLVSRLDALELPALALGTSIILVLRETNLLPHLASPLSLSHQNHTHTLFPSPYPFVVNASLPRRSDIRGTSPQRRQTS